MAAKTAKLSQVGQLYFGGVGQFYIGANTMRLVPQPNCPNRTIVVTASGSNISCTPLMTPGTGFIPTAFAPNSDLLV